MSKRVSIYTVAKEAGVSTATVSKIINNSGSISRETSDRVLEIIKKYNFVPQQRRQTGSAIGVVTFLLRQGPLMAPFTARLLNGACRQAFLAGRDLVLIDGERLAGLTPEELYCHYASNSLAGLLICNVAAENPFCTKLRKSGIPFILLANGSTDDSVNFVTTRNYEAVYELVDYMLCLGHRRIAYMGVLNRAVASHRERLLAFYDIHNNHGIDPYPEYVLDLPDAEISTIKNALTRLFARLESPTALFIGGEELDKAYTLLPQLGIEVPARLSVAGLRLDDPLDSGVIEWSCITQPTERIGCVAAQKLLELAEGQCAYVREYLDNSLNYGNTVIRHEE